jgi:hypothetical protein
MAGMFELIREKKAPDSILRRAARGELSVPPGEAVAILSLLMSDGELRHEAEQTLQNLAETPLRQIASDGATPPEILCCLLRTQGHRPAIIEALCENAALPIEQLENAARRGDASTLESMMRSTRVRNSTRLLRLMKTNPALQPVGAQSAPAETVSEANAEPQPEAQVESVYSAGKVKELLLRYSDGYPVPAEEERPFELVRGQEGESDFIAELLERANAQEHEERGQEQQDAELQEHPELQDSEEQATLSLIQKIGRMRVGERIRLALRGGREERMILIRDRSRLVCLAVLHSPKVDDSEMQAYAAMKNVQESVLRAIAADRKNMKVYGVIKALVHNPKTPLDVALRLMLHLLMKDMRTLAFSKDVNETLRKRAMRLYRLKTETKQQS